MNLAPFSTIAIDHPDQSYSDMLAESERLFQRQRAIDLMLSGTVDAEYVLDMLSEHQINPTAYVDCVESNLIYLCPGIHLEV